MRSCSDTVQYEKGSARYTSAMRLQVRERRRGEDCFDEGARIDTATHISHIKVPSFSASSAASWSRRERADHMKIR